MAGNFWETPEFQQEFNKAQPSGVGPVASSGTFGVGGKSLPSDTTPWTPQTVNTSPAPEGTPIPGANPPTDPTAGSDQQQSKPQGMFGPSAQLSDFLTQHPASPFAPPTTYQIHNPFAAPDQQVQNIPADTNGPSWTDQLFKVLGLGMNIPKEIIGNPNLPAPISDTLQWAAKWGPLSGALGRTVFAAATYKGIQALNAPDHLGITNALAASGLLPQDVLTSVATRQALEDNAHAALNNSVARVRAIRDNMAPPGIQNNVYGFSIDPATGQLRQGMPPDLQTVIDNNRWDAAYDKIVADSRGLNGMAQDNRRAAYAILATPGTIPQADLDQAKSLISQAQLETQKAAGWGDPTFAYTFDVDPARRDAFRAALVEAEMEKRAPLDSYEINSIKDHFVDPWEELPGEVALDLFNILGLYEKPGELLGDASKFIGNKLANSTILGGDGALQALGNVMAQGQVRATLATKFGNFASTLPVVGDFARYLLQETNRSAAARLAATASDTLGRLANAATDMDSFNDMLKTAGDGGVLDAASIGERENQVLKSMRNVVNGGDQWSKLADDATNNLRQQASAAYRRAWNASPQAQAVYDSVLSSATQSASTAGAAQAAPGLTQEAQEFLAKVDAGGMPAMITKNLERIAGENGVKITGSMTPQDVVDALRAAGAAAASSASEAAPAAADALEAARLAALNAKTEFVTSQVNDAVERLVSNPKSIVPQLAGQFADAYRAAHIIPGTALSDDDLLALIARKLGVLEQAKPGIQMVNGMADWLTNNWMAATSLARPGSSVTRNVNALFQYMIGGGHLFDDLGSILTTDFAKAQDMDMLLPADLAQSLLNRQMGATGTVADRLLAGWRPTWGPLTTITDRWNALRNPATNGLLDLAASASAGLADGAPLMDKLAGDPLPPVADTGKGAIKAARDAWKAWIGGWSDWNQAVSFNLRARMFHEVLNSTYDGLEQNLLPDTMKLVAGDPKLYPIAMSLWNEAGKDPDRFQQLTQEFLGQAAGMGAKYTRLVPPDIMGHVGAMTPSDRSLFMNHVLTQLRNTQAMRPLDDVTIRTVFGDIERQLQDYAVSAAARAPSATAPAAEAAAQAAADKTLAMAAQAKALSGKNTDAITGAVKGILDGVATVQPAAGLGPEMVRVGLDAAGKPLLEYDAEALAKLSPSDARVRLYDGVSRLAAQLGGPDLAMFGDPASLAVRVQQFLSDPAAVQRANPKLAEAIATTLDRNPEVYATFRGLLGTPLPDYRSIVKDVSDEGYRLGPIDYTKILNDRIGSRVYQTAPAVQAAGQNQAASRATFSRMMREALDAGTVTNEAWTNGNEAMRTMDAAQGWLHNWWLDFAPDPLHNTGKARRSAWDYFDELRAQNYQAVADWTQELQRATLRGETITMPSLDEMLTRSGMKLDYDAGGHIARITMPGPNGTSDRVYTNPITILGLESNLLRPLFPRGLPDGLTADKAIAMPLDELETTAKGYINAVRAPVDVPKPISADTPVVRLTSAGTPAPKGTRTPVNYTGDIQRDKLLEWLKTNLHLNTDAAQADQHFLDALAGAWENLHPGQDWYKETFAGMTRYPRGIHELPEGALTQASEQLVQDVDMKPFPSITPGGSGSFNPVQEQAAPTGFGVNAPAATRVIPAAQFFADPQRQGDLLADYATEHLPELLRDDSYITWDHAGGEADVVLNVSRNVPDEYSAIQQGITSGQASIYDYTNGQPLYLDTEPGRTAAQQDGAAFAQLVPGEGESGRAIYTRGQGQIERVVSGPPPGAVSGSPDSLSPGEFSRLQSYRNSLISDLAEASADGDAARVAQLQRHLDSTNEFLSHSQFFAQSESDPASSWYLKSRRLIQQKMRSAKTQPVEAVQNFLRGQVSQEELAATGLDSYLAARSGGKVTQQELLDHLDQNTPELIPMVLGEKGPKPEPIPLNWVSLGGDDLTAVGYDGAHYQVRIGRDDDWFLVNSRDHSSIPFATPQEAQHAGSAAELRAYAADPHPVFDYDEVGQLRQDFRDAMAAKYGSPNPERWGDDAQTWEDINADGRARYSASQYMHNQQPTLWSDRTSPGGTNYREALLLFKAPKSPQQQELTSAYEAYDSLYEELSEKYPQGWRASDGTYWRPSGMDFDQRNSVPPLSADDDQAFAAANQRTYAATKAAQESGADELENKYRQFSDFHGRDIKSRNPIAVHIRYKDRLDTDGRRILAIEEIQSDLAQRGRDQGFYTPEVVQRIQALQQLAEAAGKNPADIAAGRREALVPILEKAQAASYLMAPPTPWADSYNKLALNYMLRKAAEDGGYDGLAWTTGATQSNRYSLAHYVDQLDWSVPQGTVLPPVGSNTQNSLVMDYLQGRLSLADLEEQYPSAFKDMDAASVTLKGSKLGKSTLNTSTPLGRLHEYVGQDITDAIKDRIRAGASSDTILGDNMQVGGLGMGEAYDKKISSIAGRMGKPFGVSVSDLPLQTGGQSVATYQVFRATVDDIRGELEQAAQTAQDQVAATRSKLVDWIGAHVRADNGQPLDPDSIGSMADEALGLEPEPGRNRQNGLSYLEYALGFVPPEDRTDADSLLREVRTSGDQYLQTQDDLNRYWTDEPGFAKYNRPDMYEPVSEPYDTFQEAAAHADLLHQTPGSEYAHLPIVESSRIEPTYQTFHYLPINDAMKTSALQGMPLFQTRGQVRAAVQFLDDGRAWLHFFSGANLSAIPHEVLGHILETQLPPESVQAVSDWMGKPLAEWGVAEKEKFAKAAEQYVRDGLPPTPELAPTMNYLRDYMGRVYANMAAYFDGVNINPSIRAVFDKALGATDDPKTFTEIAPARALGLLRTDTDPLIHTAFKDTFRWMQQELRSVGTEGDFYSDLLREYPHWSDVIAGAPEWDNPRVVLNKLLENEMFRAPDAPMDPETRALVSRMYEYAAGELTHGTPYNPPNPYILSKINAPQAILDDATAKFQSVNGISDAGAWLAQKQQNDIEAELARAWDAWAAAPRYPDGRSLREVWPAQATKTQAGFDSYISDAIDRLKTNYGPRADDLTSALQYIQQEARSFGAQAMQANQALLPEQLSAREQQLAAQFPVMIPYWQLPDEIKTWLGRAENIQAQADAATDTLHYWRDWLLDKANSGDPMATQLTDQQRGTFATWADQAAKAKYSLLDQATNGNPASGIEGALPHTNKFMLNYQHQTNFDQIMRTIFPFWMMPSRSIPFYLEYMASHPWLPAAYAKLVETSQRVSYAAGATTSDGHQLPSLEGYFPLPGTNVWFNPTSMLRFRYALPRASQAYNDVDEAQTPLQQTYTYLDQMGRDLGFYLPPWVTIPARALDVADTNRLPSFSLVPELQLVPPWVESDVMEKLSRAASPGIKDFWYNYINPTPPWQDYLVEREVLRNALDQMHNPNLTPDQKMSLATDARDALTQREGNPAYDVALRSVQNQEYGRDLAGFFTGVFPQQYSEGAAELAALRDQVNQLRDSINSETNAALFDVPGDSAARYNAYTDRRYNTPDGYLVTLYNDIRFTQTPQGVPVYGQQRRDLISQSITQDQDTSSYYSALSALSDQLNARLRALPVGGDPTVTSAVWDWYFNQRQQIENSPAYADAQRPWTQSIKPDPLLAQHYTDQWYQMIRATQPQWDQANGQSYTDWQAAVQNWRDSFPQIVQSLSKSFADQANSDALQAPTNAEQTAGLAKSNQIVQWLTANTTPQSYDDWNKANDTPLDALNNAWRTTYWDPYWNAVNGQSGYNYTLAEQTFLQAHPNPPTPDELATWVMNNYPAGKFTYDQLVQAAQSQGEESISDRTRPADDTTALQQQAYDILDEAGPGAGQTNLINAFIKAGGSRSDIDVFYDTGGAWKDPTKLATFVGQLQQAAAALKLGPPTTDQLTRWLQVQNLNQAWQQQATAQFGPDILNVIADYGAASTSARTAMRAADPRITKFYDAKDAYGTQHPDWAIYYDTYIAQKLGLNPSAYATSGAVLVDPNTGLPVPPSSSGAGTTTGGTTTRTTRATTATRKSAAPRAAAAPRPLTSVQMNAAIRRDFIPMARRSAGEILDYLDATKLGTGKLGGAPNWPDDLWARYGHPPPGLADALGTTAIQQLAAGVPSQPLTDFLSSLALSNPQYQTYLQPIIEDQKGNREAVPTPAGGAGTQANANPVIETVG